MYAGVETLERFGLNAEASLSDDIESAGPSSDFLTSAHAPTKVGEARLNYAATDDDFREMSIKQITDYIDRAARYPRVKKINMHFSPKRWHDEDQTGGREGDYDRLIDGIRRIAGFAAGRELEVVLENGNAYWADIPDEVPWDQVDWSERNGYFGSSPEEWARVCEDVARANVGLCLDSSHVCTYAHMFPPEQREERVMAFVARPDLIRHVHWSDNYLYDARGRTDSHALLGKGSLPIGLHRAIKGLGATHLVEHFYGVEELEEELEFIEAL